MDDDLRMLIINPNKKISPKSSGTSRNKVRQRIRFSKAKSAISGKMASSSKMLDA